LIGLLFDEAQNRQVHQKLQEVPMPDVVVGLERPEGVWMKHT
jgi:hypothetical protein